jgi:neutral ceramidase
MRKYIALRSIMSVSVVLLILHIFCPAGQAMLKGGCAKVNITSPLGIPLIGSYGKPSDDVLDELYAKALVLNDGRTTIAIVSVDLLYAPLEEITNPIREIIEEEIDIPERNVFICATHTHSGPEVFTRSKLRPQKEVPASEIDQFYLQTLIRKTASSVMLAYKNMQDSSLKAGAQVKVGAAKGADEIMIKQALALISQIK